MQKENKQQSTALNFLMKRMFKYPFKLFSIILFALLGNILILLGPKLMGDAIDMLAQDKGYISNELWKLLGILIIIYVLASFFQWLLGHISSLISANVIKELRKEIYYHLNYLSLNFFHHTSYGDITAMMSTDIDQVNDGLINGLPQLFSGIVSLIGSIYFMFSISWKVALVIICLIPAISFVSEMISRNSFNMYRLEAEQRARLNGFSEEIITEHKLARTLQASKDVIPQYKEMNEELYTYGQKAQFYSALVNPSTRLINAISYISCGSFAAILAIRGELTVGQVGSLLFYTNQFSKPINLITEIISQVQASLASAYRIYELLQVEPTEIENKETPKFQFENGEIDFEQVYFSYIPTEPLIKNLNIKIPAKSKVAIVGPTGAGKTTLVNLLMRFYELDQGQIIVDGQSISNVTRDSIRKSFGMVLQEVWLFEGTVFENLTFANPDVPREKVIQICKDMEADSFIRRLENGYDTVINAKTSLSQGQKQLLTVARVMIQNPKMVILDEATSAIDTVTEMRVQKAFDKMMQNRTSFIIAHRLSTILDAEIILVMNEGNIVEKGNFKSLMQKDTLFKHIYNSQFKDELI